MVDDRGIGHSLIAVQAFSFAFDIGPGPLMLASTPSFIFSILAPAIAVMLLGCWRKILIYEALFAGLLIPLASLLMPFFLCGTVRYLHDVDDWQLYRLDQIASPDFTRTIIVAFKRMPIFGRACSAVYDLLPLVVLVPAALEARSGRFFGSGLLSAFLLAPCIGFVFYLFVPAVGPMAFLGPSFGAVGTLLPSNLAGFHDPLGVRSAFPSLHVTWAFLGFLTANRLGAICRVCSGLLLVATLLAIIGFGEHYIIDLIVAMPLVLVVRALTACTVWHLSNGRLVSVLSGLGLLSAWCALIKIDVEPAQHANELRCLMVMTVGIPIIMLQWLSRVESITRLLPSVREHVESSESVVIH